MLFINDPANFLFPVFCTELTQAFMKEAAQLHPSALILEGTNVDKKANVSEREVYKNAFKAIDGAGDLVIADANRAH